MKTKKEIKFSTILYCHITFIKFFVIFVILNKYKRVWKKWENEKIISNDYKTKNRMKKRDNKKLSLMTIKLKIELKKWKIFIFSSF